MNLLKTILSALLVFVYPVAAGYCLFEKMEIVAAVDCCPGTASHDDEEKTSCGGYGCCPIEYAVYWSFDSGVPDVATPPVDAACPEVVLLSALFSEAPVLLLERSPPEISKSWQFLLRAAPTPRAPSLLS